MSIYFTSDLHFGHSNVIKYCNRPFRDVNHMNEELIRLFNETVSPEDHVYVLGDFSMSSRSVELFTKRLNGTKHLIYGNHDFCSHLHRRGSKDPTKWKQFYLDNGWASVQDRLTIQIDGKDVLLHHFPYIDLEDGDHPGYVVRYKEERQKDEGLIILHGHVHGRWLKKGNCIDVGVDVPEHGYKPVSLDQIKEIIK